MSGKFVGVFEIPQFIIMFPVIHSTKKGVSRNCHGSWIARYMNYFSFELFRKIVLCIVQVLKLII